MKDESLDHASSKHDEVTEELALREALKRTRLEEAAKNPELSPSLWIIYIPVGGLLFYFRGDLVDILWILILFSLFHIESSSRGVHSRIDALLELDRLNKEITQVNENKKQNKSEMATPRNPSDLL